MSNMVIEKQINVRGNGNVVADHVSIYIGSDQNQKKTLFGSLLGLMSGILGIALGMSLVAPEINPSLAGSLTIAFLISIALLLRGVKSNGAVERGAEGHFQHDLEKPTDGGR